MNELEEQNLLKRAINGDAQAFADLLDVHYMTIYRMAYKMCGNREDAEDIAQDVCIKIGRHVRDFRMDCAFTSWIYRITLNTMRDAQRSRKPNVGEDALEGVASGEESPEQRASRRELWRAVNGLPDKQREAIWLVYSEELSHAEAAIIMECKESTVSWHIHEAKKQLGQVLS